MGEPWSVKKRGVVSSSVRITGLPGIKLVPCRCSEPPRVTSVLPPNVARLGARTVSPMLTMLEMIKMAAKRRISHTGAHPPGGG